MRRETIKEYLKYEFTPAELAEIAEDMAKAAEEMDAAEARKKSVTAQVKAEYEKAAAEHKEHYQKYRNRGEYRNIKCEKLFDDIKGTVTITRLDTGEVVKQRAMTSSERQQELDLGGRESGIDREPDVDETDADADVIDAEFAPMLPEQASPDSDGEDYTEEDEPTQQDIERGVEEHGARLEQP